MASNDWEPHKATIVNQFILENTPLHQVVAYMETHHSFVRTKAQYEYQLKKWGIRKNVSKKASQYAAHEANKRKGKRTEITFSDIPLSEERARRLIQRHTNIPTASDYRAGLPSPKMPSGMIIRLKTPPPIELDVPWPSTLPWFLFKNRMLPTLRNPSGLLKAYFDTRTQYEAGDTAANKEKLVMALAWKDPLQLRRVIRRLSDAIPNDLIDRQHKVKALARDKLYPSFVAEMLKVIFFRLSNNLSIDDFDHDYHLHDQFVICLVQAISESNPEMLSALFSGNCPTTKAIKDAVYWSAIRERNYDFVERLIESGVNPDLPISGYLLRPTLFRRGEINLAWGAHMPVKYTGMHYAAYTLDVRLARILLAAGASASVSGENITSMELAAVAGYRADSGSAVDFMQILVERGATVQPPALKCSCGKLRTSLFFALAIADSNHQLAEFLVENGAIAEISKYSQVEVCSDSWRCGRWHSTQFLPLHIPYSPIEISIVLGNKGIVEQLLPAIISHPIQSLETVKKILLTSCLVGDMDLTSKILKSVGIDLNDGWYNGVTPLVASAWNPDTSIAKMLLDSGANVGPTAQEAILETPELCPIHVAAYHGNVTLVQQLIDRGANFSVRYHYRRGYLSWLAPSRLSSPLQFALDSGNVPMMKIFLSHFNLLSGDPGDDTLISDICLAERLVRSVGRTAFAVAIEAGSAKLVRFYISSGEPYSSRALFLATWTAIQSKDYTIFKLLAGHRPPRQIDSTEASALVLSIVKEQWSLVELFLSDPFLPGAARSCYEDPNEPFFLRWCLESHEGFEGFEGYESFDGGTYARLTPLSAAFWSGNACIVESMIQRGFTIQHRDVAALIEGKIADREIPATIREGVLSKFPLHNIDSRYIRGALSHTIRSGDVEIVRKYSELFETFDFEFKYFYQYITPIALAALEGHLELVRYFLEESANPDCVPPLCEPAVLSAAKRGHVNIVEFLLNRNEVVSSLAHSQSAAKALISAAKSGYLTIMELLIEHGADVNKRPDKEYERTALEAAAEKGRLDSVQLLLNKRCQLDGSMRLFYVRAVKFAIVHGHHAIANHLKQHGSWNQEDQRIHDCFGSYGEINTNGNEVLGVHQEVVSAFRMLKYPSPTEFLNTGLTNEKATHQGLATQCALGSRDFTAELGEVHEGSNMALQTLPQSLSYHGNEWLAVSMSCNTASTGATENRARDEIYALEEEIVVGEQPPSFEVLGVNITQGQDMLTDFVDIEWEILASAGEFSNAANAPREFINQRVVDITMPDTDLSNEQVVPFGAVDPGWVGPFTGADNLEVLDDLQLDFSTW
ncbi:ankyrin repeat-containing domain protein [Nemania abortiva]|nr:ankyrin repeat-containing domain protein [Nemania abortiva]